MRYPSVLFQMLLLVAPLAVVTPLAAQTAPPQYVVQELGSSAWGLTIANDLNNHGVIVGEWDSGTAFASPRHAVAWIDGQMIDLTPGPEFKKGSATSVNDRGVIVGNFTTDGTYPSGAFRWTNGVFEVVPTFAPGFQKVYGIGAGGDLYGTAMSETFQVDAHTWNVDLADQTLRNLGHTGGVAYDGNARMMVGVSGVNPNEYHAVAWTESGVKDFGVLPGTIIARAYSVNGSDEVVGFSGSFLDDNAFYWSKETGMVDLGDLGFAPGASANDINEHGVIVGYADQPGARLAVVWHDFQIHALNDLLVNGGGWSLYSANGINDLGQIVGHGRRNGLDVAYLATPVAPTKVPGPVSGQPVVAPAVDGSLRSEHTVGEVTAASRD